MAALSGQTTVTTAGTEVALGTGRANAPVSIKALAANTGYMYVGNAGDNTVASTSGYQLAAGEQVTLSYLGDLGDVMVDSSVNGEKVCWLILGSM
jgi:hypothetical protein